MLSFELEQQLSEYGRQLDSQIVTLEPADVKEIAPKPPVRRGWLTAVASAAPVLVLVGGSALLFRVVGSDTPVATAPVNLSSSLTWSRVPHDDAVFSGSSEVWNDDVIVLELLMSDVVVGGPGLVAVGREEWPDVGTPSAVGPQTAVVWTSVDGTTWTRLPDNDAVFGGAEVGGVIAGGPGLIAVGSHTPGRRAVVWTSPDGTTWSRVPYDESVFGDAAMLSVTPFGSGYVAVGRTGEPRTGKGIMRQFGLLPMASPGPEDL